MTEVGYFGEILVRHELLSPERVRELASTAEERGVQLADVIRATRAIEESELVRALAAELGLEFVAKIDPSTVPEAVIEQVPINFARQQKILPIGERDETVIAATSDPLDPAAADDLRALLGRPIELVAATSETIDDAINRVYERKDEASLGEKDNADEVDEIQDLLDADDEAPVIRFVNNLFYTSVRERASDIHIEPLDDKVIVRYRIDGRLVQRKEAPKGAHASIIARVKIEAGLNIAEKRLPQDGRITKKIAGKVIDVRVSTIPTAKGESVVMRLLDKENIALDLADLGFARRELDLWNRLIERPNGILLVTGPTGSGKTTTLYGSLNRINKPDKKILTAEEPVEYELRGINQLQVHSKIGLTFASALRAFLRQDPDVIMVGEIRDHETAELAIQASLTGHLVLSTLHTNDAPGAITRLVDMGIQTFQISSTVLGVLAQRLVRRLCVHCREPYAATMEKLQELGIDLDRVDETLAQLEEAARSTVLGRNSAPPATPGEEEEELDADELLDDEPTGVHDLRQIADAFEQDPSHLGEKAELAQMLRAESKPKAEPKASQGIQILRAADGMPIFYKPVGCEACSHTGYRGRLGIFELMLIDGAVRAEILKQSDSKTIARAAQASGMRVLRDDGARQVLAGVTSVEEVLAATQEAGD
ncbi:MAG: Flp pilus assembly complex ATPase component TadA [Sandaracinus sp.]|nr:Flp pilus assembly complex ATPase component TadA [Sandaracinus sp.]